MLVGARGDPLRRCFFLVWGFVPACALQQPYYGSEGLGVRNEKGMAGKVQHGMVEGGLSGDSEARRGRRSVSCIPYQG